MYNKYDMIVTARERERERQRKEERNYEQAIENQISYIDDHPYQHGMSAGLRIKI